MTERNDGGPAFPRTSDRMGYGATRGMTLRDWFAGQLAAAELASAGANVDAAIALNEGAIKAGQTIEQRIAYHAYRIADALLAERSKP
jgi:hypothetical protein